jgi:hypothetical protein
MAQANGGYRKDESSRLSAACAANRPEIIENPPVLGWYGPCFIGLQDRVMTKTRLVLEVPASLALMPPAELDSYVRSHWHEWEGKWRRMDRGQPADAILRMDAGDPIYLLQRGATHYLVAEATAVPFDAAA